MSDPGERDVASETSTDGSAAALGRILVLGASGYVGGRLAPMLVRRGATVRCMTRSPQAMGAIEWADDVEIVEGDLLDPASLDEAFADVDQVVYLVHSLDDGEDFEAVELECARNARTAAESAGVDRIVYLSGLGDEDEDLSPHLRSRHAVGKELASGPTAVIELRAAIVLGAGSASFEMLRSLVEVLPVMVTPKWVTHTRVQPVAIVDVLTYLWAALGTGRNGDASSVVAAGHRVVEIGSPSAITYRELMDEYARVAGLRRRLLIPVPVVSPRLSSHWVHLVTPLPTQLSSTLIDSLRHDVVVTDDSASTLSAHEPLDVATAIELSIAEVDGLDIPTRWSGVTPEMRAAQPQPWDPSWSGGTVYEDCRERRSTVPAPAMMRTIRGIGGDRGWYGFGPLWAFRGLIDQLVGGVGLRRGRRHPDDIAVGEALDFWRVAAMSDDLFRLRAEMKVPGQAWLEWQTSADADGGTLVRQRARYVPAGVWGRIYWFGLVPLHVIIFPMMLRRIVAAAEREAAAAS